ncbi:histidine kinase [Miniphocaeibacter massiliensis]|uniref:histidine kinase n=1 Tax=Miniphocaeibacter massiliensis TaxID=2041841 RepID=UPI000C08B49E|nr:histidine kinase [Miniphocaeibacter massiliensis]
MSNIKSSLIIWLVTTIYLILNFPIGNSLIAVICLGFLGILFLCKNKIYQNLTCILFFALIFYEYKFAFFIPVFMYYLLREENFINIILFTISEVLVFYALEYKYFTFVSVVIIFAFTIKMKDIKNYLIEEKYRNFVIDSKETQIFLQKENNRLIDQQDKGIENAILNERNRIARDIHDGVGHIISRTILQIGAMLVIEKDENKKQNLNSIKSSLNESMTELRRSLHNLQEDNIDLRYELQKIVEDYTFSDIVFNYSLDEEKDLNFKYSIIYIINESLNNIIKHSDATIVEINLRETEDNIYILVKDNGSKKSSLKYGIGLNSIEARVKTINGQLQVSNENGFRIFINIEKEEI